MQSHRNMFENFFPLFDSESFEFRTAKWIIFFSGKENSERFIIMQALLTYEPTLKKVAFW